MHEGDDCVSWVLGIGPLVAGKLPKLGAPKMTNDAKTT
jgi:hypothetical protein